MSLPISVIIPTRNRAPVLEKALNTFLAQDQPAAEIIVIDGSDSDETRLFLETLQKANKDSLIYLKAEKLGAAIQRNQGVAKSSHPFVLFADDDVYLEKDVVGKLWSAINSGPRIGGVNALITNQKYLPMGKISTTLARILYGGKLDSYAGKLLTPGWGVLTEDRDDMPEVVEVEWLNLGATLYRKEALPDPPFQSYFKGYSIMEDVTLSAHVAKSWTLCNARTARIYHDSQPGEHKKNMFAMARMEVSNRHYLMTQVMMKRRFADYMKFALYETFGIVTNVRSFEAVRKLPAILAGKICGIYDILVK